MRRPSERLTQRIAKVSESFRQDPPIYLVDWELDRSVVLDRDRRRGIC